MDKLDFSDYSIEAYTDCAPDGDGNIIKDWYHRYDSEYSTVDGLATDVWGAITTLSYYGQKFDQLAPNSVAAQLAVIDDETTASID